MGIFKKNKKPQATWAEEAVINAVDIADGMTGQIIIPKLSTAELEKSLEQEKNTAEEWIWVEGYKGTDNDMKCRDYQYELGKQFDIPDDQKIEDCVCGFHLCLNLRDVFRYYCVGDGHRYWKVKALVRKSDFDEYGNKLAAKSIIFISEVPEEELFKEIGSVSRGFHELPIKYQREAMECGISEAGYRYKIDTLIEDGYSQAFADHIVRHTSKYEAAHTIASQKDLSMDIKVLYIINTSENTFNVTWSN